MWVALRLVYICIYGVAGRVMGKAALRPPQCKRWVKTGAVSELAAGGDFIATHARVGETLTFVYPIIHA